MFKGSYAEPYIIAEIGMNYEGSMERAKRMIDAVARAGGHAAKFQTYKADSLASASSSPSYWDLKSEATESQHALFRKYDAFGPSEYKELADHCTYRGIDFLSTPFFLEAVDYLSPLMPAIKVASADLTNVPLLRRIALTGKPVILSVGASTFDEVGWALDILEASGALDVTILHCVLNYPTPVENANLLGIKRLISEFSDRATVGYSDHVAPRADGRCTALEMAVILGARVLEKHFTDDRNLPGNDHYHAFDEAGLSNFVRNVAEMQLMKGTGDPDIEAQRSAVTNARRRIFAARDISAGSVITPDDLIALRSNAGIEVAQWDSVVGATSLREFVKGSPVAEDSISRMPLG